LSHLEAYLAIEQARFPNRYQITIDVPKELMKAEIPPFVIQILVENALKHAFAGRKNNNQVLVQAMVQEPAHLLLRVRDNGQGIPSEKVAKLGKEVVSSAQGTGSALENLNRRLLSLFGESAQLVIHSDHSGSLFEMTIPLKMEQKEEEHESRNY